MKNINVNVPEISGAEKYFIGRYQGEVMYLSKPSFDCGWYWGFGYIGNRNAHMHLNGVLNETSKNWYDAFNVFTDLPKSLQNDDALWKFVETMRTLYSLRKVADIYHTGGSHLMTPVVSLKNEAMYQEIVEKQMPQLFEAIVEILK